MCNFYYGATFPFLLPSCVAFFFTFTASAAAVTAVIRFPWYNVLVVYLWRLNWSRQLLISRLIKLLFILSCTCMLMNKWGVLDCSTVLCLIYCPLVVSWEIFLTGRIPCFKKIKNTEDATEKYWIHVKVQTCLSFLHFSLNFILLNYFLSLARIREL